MAARRTPKEIEELKRQWEADPIWDLEDTPGFEAHKEELKDHSDYMKQEWRLHERARMEDKSVQLGTPGNITLARYVDAMEKRIEKLEAKLNG